MKRFLVIWSASVIAGLVVLGVVVSQADLAATDRVSASTDSDPAPSAAKQQANAEKAAAKKLADDKAAAANKKAEALKAAAKKKAEKVAAAAAEKKAVAKRKAEAKKAAVAAKKAAAKRRADVKKKAAAKKRASTVIFKVKGTGKPDVTYLTDGGSHSDNDNEGAFGMDYASLPSRGQLKLDEEAMYYAVNAQLGDGGGKITCQVIINGQVVADGSASGPYQICSAQANADMLGGFS